MATQWTYFHLKEGVGAPCAGQVNLKEVLTLWVSRVKSVSDGNFGADPPIGSKKQPCQNHYLYIGLGYPWAGQVNTDDPLAEALTLDKSECPVNLGVELPTGSN